MAISTITTLLLTALGLDGTVFPKQANLTDNSTFDYIIVGGGTAGCVLARRLVENSTCTVLVLEAGDDPTATSLLPGEFSSLPKSQLDYNYTSTFDAYAAGGQGNYTQMTSGKVLGGSSALNHLLWSTNVKEDYNSWAAATGDKRWSYDEVFPYFTKSENLTDEEILNVHGLYYGSKGPIGLSRQLHNEDVADDLAAFAEALNPTLLDLNFNETTGYLQPLYTIAKGLRQTTSYSYLKAVKDNSNLYVSKNTVVSKVIFSNDTTGGNLTAVAVEATYNGVNYTFRANKEIILSAGVFNTPQVLQRSGVGPQDHLTSLNISVVSNLPVGDNLIAPTAVVIVLKTKNYSEPIPDPSKLLLALNPTLLPFPVLLGSVARNKTSKIPDYQNYNLKLPHDTTYLESACTSVYGYREDICVAWQADVVSRDALYSVIVNLDTKSRGTVRIKSCNATDDPIITTGFYNYSEDLNNTLKNIKDFLLVLNTTVYEAYGADVVGLDLAECADKEKGSDEFWFCYILSRTISHFNYWGTCPMGTVVDGGLKVKGINSLRIVDASVIPGVMHGAINAAVIALAERAADIIKASA